MTDYNEQKKELAAESLIRKALSSYEFLQVVPMLLLILTGIAFIYGIGQQIGTAEAERYWKKQLFWTAAGLCLWFYLAVFFDYRHLKKLAPLIYVLALAGLVGVLLMGARINDSRRWFLLGPVMVQPSEFSKLALIIVNASVLSIKNFDVNRLNHFAALVLLNGAPFVLTVMEPDLGAAVMLVPVVGLMVFAAGLKFRWIFLAALFIGCTIWFSFPFLKDYQKERINTFFNPEKDPANRGWNALQSQLAVGSGGFFGKGFMQGTQNTLGFLPRTVSKTDFIFSVIAEETGFAGSLFIIGLYLALLASIFRIAISTCDDFGRFMTMGVAAVFFLHSFINMGMTMRLLPVKGLPLPLVSYGGSFMICNLVALGILQSVYRLRKTEL